MRFSTAIVGLLFGLEAAALRAVSRTGPEIERAVCPDTPMSVAASLESAHGFVQLLCAALRTCRAPAFIKLRRMHRIPCALIRKTYL
jgi:hypothetical protein